MMSTDDTTEKMEMPCQVCTADTHGVRTLAVTTRENGTENLEMSLCESCFAELTDESWIRAESIAAE